MLQPRAEALIEAPAARQELLLTGYYFPNFPIRAQIRDVHLRKQEKDEEDNCTKHYKHAGRLGAGLMMVWCVKHRECIGFTVLRSAESCKELYDILSTRFLQMPRIVIYDNACNLFEVGVPLANLQYCFNRNPQLFANTSILCDGIHYKNHTNCSATFNCLEYTAMSNLSSVTHEQKNQYLDRLKTTSVFMRWDVFTSIIVDMLANLNFREREYNV
jgi:hypothetical protein